MPSGRDATGPPRPPAAPGGLTFNMFDTEEEEGLFRGRADQMGMMDGLMRLAMGLDVNASDLGLIDEGEPDHVVPPSALPNFGGPLSQLFFHANRPPQGLTPEQTAAWKAQKEAEFARSRDVVNEVMREQSSRDLAKTEKAVQDAAERKRRAAEARRQAEEEEARALAAELAVTIQRRRAELEAADQEEMMWAGREREATDPEEKALAAQKRREARARARALRSQAASMRLTGGAAPTAEAKEEDRDEEAQELSEAELQKRAARNKKRVEKKRRAKQKKREQEQKEAGQEQRGGAAESRSSVQQEEEEVVLTIDPEDLHCPISLELMTDPVVAEDGISYQREAFEEYIQFCTDGGKQLVSPSTREVIKPVYVRNVRLRQQVLDYIEATKRRQAATGEASSEEDEEDD